MMMLGPQPRVRFASMLAVPLLMLRPKPDVRSGIGFPRSEHDGSSMAILASPMITSASIASALERAG